MAALFELTGITASRGGREVLHDVTAAIPEGVTAIVGESGAGKSTLLRLLNRLADPQRGSVRFDGKDLRDWDVLDLRRRACLVPQTPALLEGTVADNLAFAAALAGADALPPQDALEAAGLDASFAERAADRLSVGEQQRAMLARALTVRPRTLLLDEPTAALDERTRAAVEATLKKLHREHDLSIVMVTHDRAQAQRLASAKLRVEDGRVVAA